MPSETQHGYAQTNLQLFNQLVDLGYPPEDLELVQRAYELGMRLFTALYQPSGKPLLCHLVGTASILAAHGASPVLVGAGLLHAAYSRGLFPRYWIGAAARRRRLLRAQIGEEALALVARYAVFPWSPSVAAGLRAGIRDLRELDRRVLSIRLANELEDHLDLGMHYAGEGDFHELYRGEGPSILADSAAELGFPALGAELARIMGASNCASRPAALRRPHAHASFVPPASRPAQSQR